MRADVHSKLAAIAIATLAALCFSTRARADEPRPYNEPHYVRAVIEEGAVLVVGGIQYATSTSNSQDWDLEYDWPSLRSKLTGDAVRFDTNHFDTNMMTHPFAGTFYYIAARGNHLSFAESFLFTAASSTLWEYLGEFRELVSVNDLIVTPISGVAFGESLTQLGTFFGRSRATPVNEILATVFAPSTRLNDAIDGTAIPHDHESDDLGLTREIGHRFELRLGVGSVNGSSSHGLDARAALQTEIIGVSGYDEVGKKSVFVTDTLVSRLGGETAIASSGLRDVQVDADVAPIGYYTHALAPYGEDRVGHRFFVGMTTGFDYGLHSYLQSPPNETDRIAGVHFGGVTAEYQRVGPLHLRTTLDVRPQFSCVESLALPAYEAHAGDPRSLPTVTRNEGYYFAAGASLLPAVEIGFDPWTIGAQARFESYWGIRGLDRHQDKVEREIELSDIRSLVRGYVAVAPMKHVSLQLGLEQRTREGRAASTVARRTEWALTTSAGVFF